MRQQERIRRGEFVRGDTPAEIVQEHLERLFEAGWTLRRLSEASGVSDQGLRKIKHRKVVRSNVAVRILAVPVESVGTLDIGVGWVPAIGTMRRVQALNAIGYPLCDIAKRVGIGWPALSDLTLGKYEFVRATNAVRIGEVFKELQLTPAPPSKGATYARTRAAKRGWVPPFMWDEESIDDPHATPQNPQGDKDDWFDDYQELKALGLTDKQIAERMGIRHQSLGTKLRRLNETSNSHQEYQPVRESYEQMVRAS